MHKFRGFEYDIRDTRDGDGFNRYDTWVLVGDKWECAVADALWTSGPRWESEMNSFIDSIPKLP